MKLYFVTFLLITSQLLFSQQKRALFIGISDYPAKSGWTKINSDNDIALLKDEIKKRGFVTNVLVDHEATKHGIVSALKELQRKAVSKDTVLIHFSCHGQQALLADKSGNTELREALIPYDAHLYFEKDNYEGQNHLIDYELGEYLLSIRKKIGADGVLFVNIDACHSGDAVRALEGDTPIRGTSAVFTDNPFYIRPNRKDVMKNKVVPVDPGLASFCAVYACQSFQNNYELKVDTSFYGSLSYAFYLTLKENKTNDPLIWAKGIISEMNKKVKKQNPYFESTFVF